MTIRDEALNMLIVDDNPVLASVLSEILRECGHHVRVASDGFVALAEIRKRVPDLLLSDLSMPGMSGYELLSVVRRRFPGIRVIAMSGDYSGESVPVGVPADAFYAKGESGVSRLIEVVRSICLDDENRPRPCATIWIAEISLDHKGPPVLLVSCPECLRPFFNQAAMGPALKTCPHCLMPVDLAVVRQSTRTDETKLRYSHIELPGIQLGAKVGHSGVVPTRRMSQS